jgi:hypothetical protein
MKSTILTFVFALVATFSFAAVLRVNNNPGVNNGTTSTVFFTTLTAAVAAAANNDIIIVEASPTAYAGVTLTKSLKIYGNGSFNTASSATQVNTARSNVQNITFNSGSENALISGLECGGISINVNNITVERCYASSITLGSATNNTTIIENLFSSGNINCSATNLNVLCKNNIIYNGGLSLSNAVTGIFENNIIGWWGSGTVNLNNAVVNFRNNIICSGSAITNYGNAVVTHNISTIAATLLPSGNNNVNGATYANVFVGAASSTTPANAQLKSGSPALGAGYDSGDIGAYNTVAGKTTFRTEQVPPIPSVYQMSTGVINGSSMNVTISTRANN